MTVLLIIAMLKAVAEKISNFILPLWAFQQTQSNDLMSYVRMFEYLPFMVLGFIIGALVDRVGSRRGFTFGTTGQVIVLAVLAWYGIQSPHLLFMLVFMLMGMTYFANNSLIVQSRLTLPDNRLITYNRYTNMVSNVMESAGPAIIGALLLLLSYTQALHFSYVLLFISLLLGVNSFRQAPPVEKKPFIPDIMHGFRALYRLRNLWVLSWWTAFANAIIVVSEVVVMYCAKSTFSFTDFQVGVLFAVGGLGAISGSWFSERIEQHFGVIRVLAYSIPLIGLIYLFISVHITPVTLGIMLFCESFLFSLYIVCVRTYRLVVAPANDLGKINGITGSIFKMFIPVSLTLYALWGNQISTGTVLGIMGILFVSGSIALVASSALKMQEKLSDNY
ncbi:MFS transporter [Dickeya poaceiphila]|uniref:MFS transporter n=1 Tax=Dickeya poaceiphila TaxID=568768 RepID=A0A5B8I784_9GAMM|nr:MFS transporter [Dickeya poaceiphila]QDX29067.1 MFS transporter [Dickeya poaceiphila]